MIEVRTEALNAQAEGAGTAMRWQEVPGAGPLTALTIESFAPGNAEFPCGRAKSYGVAKSCVACAT